MFLALKACNRMANYMIRWDKPYSPGPSPEFFMQDAWESLYLETCDFVRADTIVLFPTLCRIVSE
jgi:hypothetical protein